MAKTFQKFMEGGRLTNNVPSVDLGAFDVVFDPGRQKLEVVVKFAIANGVHPAGQNLYQQGENPQINLQRFSREYTRQIPTAWNGKVILEHTAQNGEWKGLKLKPLFRVEEVPLQGAHYKVEIIPESVEQHTQRDPTGIVTPEPINNNAGFQPRKAYMGSQSTLDKGMRGYGVNTRWDLDKGVAIPLTTAVGVAWTPAGDPAGWARLKAYIRNTARFKVPLKFRSSTRPDVVMTGSGMGSDATNKALAQTVHNHMRTMGFKNPTTYDSGNAVGEKSVLLTMDKAQLKELFPPRTAEKNSLYKQITTAHEFGHMIGLPDEYLCMHQRTQDAMSEVYSQSTMESLKGQGGNQITDNAEAHVVKHQQAFISLCAEAQLVAPPFGRMSSSMMSNGMVLHPWHFVTVWESLKRFSEHSNWKIVMT